MPQPLSAYEKITFEEATRIIYFFFSDSKGAYQLMMEELMVSSDHPSKSIAPRWYESYKNHLTENKRGK